MTSRERLKRCFNHEELDRPAIFSRIGFPPNGLSYDRLKKLLQEKTELKMTWAPEKTEPEVEVVEEPYSDEFSRKIKQMKTPTGVLEEVQLVGLKNQYFYFFA